MLATDNNYNIVLWLGLDGLLVNEGVRVADMMLNEAQMRSLSLLAQRLQGGTPYFAVISNQAVGSLFNFLVTVFLVHRLGLTEFGVYNIFLVLSLGLVALINALITQPMVSLGSQMPDDERNEVIEAAKRLLLTALVVLLIVGAVTAMFGALMPFGGHDILLLAIVAGSMVSSEFFRRLLFFQGKAGRVWGYDAVRLTLVGVTFAALGGFWHVQVAWPYVTALASSNFAALLGAWFASGGNAPLRNAGSIRSKVEELLHSGKWLSMSSAVLLVAEQAPVLLAAAILGPVGVGSLRAPQSIIGVVNPLLLALENVVPRALGESLRDLGWQRGLQRYLWSSVVLLTGAALLLGTLALFAHPIVSLVLGHDAARYAWVLQILAVAYMGTFATILAAYAIRASNHNSVLLWANVAAAATSVVGSLILMPMFGILGAALTLLAAPFAGLLVLICYLTAKWPLAPRPAISPQPVLAEERSEGLPVDEAARGELPPVSVIVPAFNAEAFIERTLQSCLAQTHRHLELIVIDDGSTDKTAAIVSAFAASDPRVVLVSKANEGLAAARNDGLARATGKYVAFLDADDLWHPTKIERQLAELVRLEHLNYAAAYCLYRFIDVDDKITEDMPDQRADGATFERHNFWNFVGNGSNFLCRTDVARQVGGFDRSLVSNGMMADWDFQLKILAAHKTVQVPEYLVGYRKYPGSMSAKASAYALARLEMMERQLSTGISPQNKKWLIGETYATVAFGYRQASNYPMVAWMTLRAFAVDPIRVINAMFIRPFEKGRGESKRFYRQAPVAFQAADPKTAHPVPLSWLIRRRLRILQAFDETRAPTSGNRALRAAIAAR